MTREAKSHSFSHAHAKEFGIVAAIFIRNLAFWIEHNRANRTNFYDDRWWTYNSIKAFQKLFWYLTEKQIRGALEKLVEKGGLFTGHYHENKYDRRTWYAFADEVRFLDPDVPASDLPSGAHPSDRAGESNGPSEKMDMPKGAGGSAPTANL